MQANILKKVSYFGAVVMAAALLAGCGGGGGASFENFDEGTTYDPVNGKTIFRSLENETDMEVLVDMYINDVEQLDRPVIIAPRSFINVEISGLDLDDYIQFFAEFENGERVEGTFSEDGATVFRGDRSRASISIEHVNGKAAVKPGGQTIKIRKRVK